MIQQDIHTGDSESAQHAAAFPQRSRRSEKENFIDILALFVQRKGLIAGSTAVAFLVGLILSLVLPVRYTAVTTLMPPRQTQSSETLLMGQLSGVSASPFAAVTGVGLGLRNPNDIYIGLLNARPIADAIIQEFNLAQVYKAKDMTAARRTLAANTLVVSEKSGFISVSVTDRDKKRAAEMANAYTEELRNFTKTIAVTEASQRRVFYEDQLKQAKESLISAEVAFQKIQQTKGMVQLDAQARAMIESLEAIRAQLTAKEVELQSLRSYSTEQNPDVAMAERQLLSLQGEAARLEQRHDTSELVNIGLKDVSGAGMDYLRAQHEVTYRQTLFDMLMKQYDVARLDEAKEATIIQVVEPAIEPDRKSSPKCAQIILMATVFGFLAGCFLVPLIWWAKKLRSDLIGDKRFENLKIALKTPRA